MTEEWRPITGSRGQYEVSNLGRVRNAWTGRMRKIYITNTGVRTVRLGGYINKTRTVGQIVAEEFLGVKPKRIRHKRNIGDDRPENIIIVEEYYD